MSHQPEEQVQLPTYQPLRSEQDVAVLQAEELKLGRQLLRDFPGQIDALIKMADIYHRQGKAQEAQAFLQEALKANPQHANAYVRLADLAREGGRLEQAIGYYRQALRLEAQMPGVLTKLAEALMTLGRQAEAIAVLKQETRRSPGNGYAHFLLGQAHLQLKDYPQARKSYELALQISPDHPKAHYGLAMVHRHLGSPAQAQAHSERFQQLKAEERKALKGRKARYADSTLAQKRAAISYLEVGRMYRDNGKLQQAESLLKQATGLDPNNVICFFELAALYNTHGAPIKALQVFKRASQIQPKHAMSHYMIGILSAHLNRFAAAETAFNTVIQLIPQAADGYRELARLYLKTGKNMEQARQLAQKAVALQASAANYHILAWACHANGDRGAALPAVKRALALEPGNPDYQRLYHAILLRN